MMTSAVSTSRWFAFSVMPVLVPVALLRMSQPCNPTIG